MRENGARLIGDPMVLQRLKSKLRRTPIPAAHPVASYRRENGAILIELRLESVNQLFNSFDPSPFHQKELDIEADRYIFTSAQEIGSDKPFKLRIFLPAPALESVDPASRQTAIRSHFIYRLQTARRDLRHELRRGRVSFAIGLAFLIICMAGRELTLSFLPSALQRMIGEGLLILGWVAMWGPLEIFLYGWWPIAGSCRLLERLALLNVDLRPL